MNSPNHKSLRHTLEDVVTIFVGDEREKFIVHTHLICSSSDFLKAFWGSFREGKEKIMSLPEETPGTFALFIEWVYYSKIPEGHSQTYVNDLYGLYFFAEKLCLTDLKDMTMDQIQDVSAQYNLDISAATMGKVYTNTPEGSKLRMYCVAVRAFVLLKDLRERESEIPDKDQYFVALQREDYVMLWGLSQGNFDFFEVFLKYFQEQLTAAQLVDPRIRKEENLYVRCYFHCHEEDYSCREKETRKKKPEFVKDVPEG